MAKKAYIGVDGVARKVKKMYVGVDDVARKIKKGYIGVGGVARPFWTGGELAYYGTTTALSVARYGVAATAVGSYALFGGGHGNGSYEYSAPLYATVDAYNTALTRSTPTALSKSRTYVAAATVGSYALFAGGTDYDYVNGSREFTTVDAYDTSLTRTTADNLGYDRCQMAATTVGSYALFGGGLYYGLEYSIGAVDAYNASLTRSTVDYLENECYNLAAATVGSYALFGGGQTYDGYNGDNVCCSAVTVYDTSLTRSVIDLSAARTQLAAATVGSYALFGGGLTWSGTNGTKTDVDTVDAFDASLTRTTATVLSQARRGVSAVSIGDYALFGGGYSTKVSGYYSDVVDVYDTSLTRTIANSLSAVRYGCATTAVGNYALFGAGYDSSSGPLSVIDAYVVA